MRRACFIVIIRLSILLKGIFATTPFVAWSMDKHNGTILIPDYNTDTRFRGDFSTLGSDPANVLVPGVVNNSMYVPNGTFDIAHNLTGSDCLKDPDFCTSGLSLTFWVKVQQWSGDHSLLRTTTASRSEPGIYFGRGLDSSVIAYARGSDGNISEVLFPESHLWNKWAHVAMVWRGRDDTLLVYVNGDLQNQSDARYAGEEFAQESDFVVGTPGATFYLDELNVYYKTLSSDEIAEIYASANYSFGVFELTTIEADAGTTATQDGDREQTTGSSIEISPKTTTFSTTTPSGDIRINVAVIVVVAILVLPGIIIIALLCSARRSGRRRYHTTRQ